MEARNLVADIAWRYVSKNLCDCLGLSLTHICRCAHTMCTTVSEIVLTQRRHVVCEQGRDSHVWD